MRLLELRQERGLTQVEVANAIGTSQRNISRWEKEENEPTVIFAIKLAQFFQVEVEYLAGYSDDLGISPPLNIAEIKKYSQEEQKLIEDFRQLNRYKQELIKNNIKAMLPAEAESERKKNKS